MLRIAIVGCGKIADQHVQAVRRLNEAEVVAVCDREPLMATQLAERFGIRGCHSDLGEMLREAKPNVVHITTPPQGHYALARECLEAGTHVYLEKPFTVKAGEAEALVGLAEGVQRIVVAGHNYQFTPEMCRMRQLVGEGFLGGRAVHLECHWPYDLGDRSYVAPLLANRNHWVRQLPGQLFHNLLSHGIARLAEFLDNELDEVVASAHQSAQLRRLGEEEILDELRVMIRDRQGTTAFFCFSTQIKPARNSFSVFGPVNSLFIDTGSGSVIRKRKRADKSYLTFFAPPLRDAAEHLRNARSNVASFLSRKLYQDSGMKELIGRFYDGIRSHGRPPIPYREVLLTARLMDEIFRQTALVRKPKISSAKLALA
jgi:predicted dehydrogenase